MINHSPNFVLGRTKNGTLQLTTDSVGLQMRVILPNTSYARDLMTSVRRGDMSQMSFAFTADDDDWGSEDDPDNSGESIKVRTLRSVKLLDVSAVTYPAYDSTELTAKDEPFFNSLERSLPLVPLDRLFPQGVPMEIRSHVPRIADAPGADRVKNVVQILMGL